MVVLIVSYLGVKIFCAVCALCMFHTFVKGDIQKFFGTFLFFVC